MSDRVERRLAALTTEITAAATAYEARWTLAALHRADPDISSRLRRQISLWNDATRSGDPDQVDLQGAALIRGYRKAIEVMTLSGAADDAYQVGKDEASGLTLAIGHQVASAEHVAAMHGPDVVFITPDEIAGLLNSLDGFSAIAAIKRAFPGALTLPESDRLTASETARKAKAGADSHG